MVISKKVALRIIHALGQGSNLLIGAHHFGKGRERLLLGAQQVLSDLEVTETAKVRLVKGDYGVGKTNFVGRVMHLGLQAGWAVCYLEQSEAVSLSNVATLVGDVARNLYLPGQLALLEAGEDDSPAGVGGLFDDFLTRIKKNMGLSSGADVPGSFRDEVMTRLGSALDNNRVYGDMAAAVNWYFRARLDQDPNGVRCVQRWLGGEPKLKFPNEHILSDINAKNAKQHLKELSSLIVSLGCRGCLIIVDELEKLMDLPPSKRRQAYTVLRELVDNADGSTGMRRVSLYCAVTPAVLEGPKGFIENEALASRVSDAAFSDRRNYLGTIVDLDSAPLTRDEKIQLSIRIRDLHAIARDWDPSSVIHDGDLTAIIDRLEAESVYARRRVRDLCKSVTGLLDEKYVDRANV